MIDLATFQIRGNLHCKYFIWLYFIGNISGPCKRRDNETTGSWRLHDLEGFMKRGKWTTTNSLRLATQYTTGFGLLFSELFQRNTASDFFYIERDRSVSQQFYRSSLDRLLVDYRSDQTFVIQNAVTTRASDVRCDYCRRTRSTILNWIILILNSVFILHSVDPLVLSGSLMMTGWSGAELLNWTS